MKKNYDLFFYISVLTFLAISSLFFLRSTFIPYKFPFVVTIVKMIGMVGGTISFFGFLNKQFSRLQILFFLIAFPCSLIVAWFSKDFTIFLIVFCSFILKDYSFKNLLKYHFVLVLVFLIITFVLAKLNIIENLVTYRNGISRESFGALYTTDFSAHIFFLLVEYSILKGKSFRLFTLGVYLFLALFVWVKCNARLDFFLIAILGIGMFIIANSNRLNRQYKTPTQVFIPLLPSIIFFMVLFTNKKYNRMDSIQYKINLLLSSRLYYGNLALNMYPITFFGQKINMIGNGGSTALNFNSAIQQYFYIDSSYLRMLLINGITGSIITLVMLGLLVIKKLNLLFIFPIVLLLIHGIIAQFIVNIGYVALITLVFSKLENKNIDFLEE